MNWIFPATIAVLWIAVRITLPNLPVDLDFDANHGTFFVLLNQYVGMTKCMVALDLVLAWYGRQNPMADHCCLAGAIAGILFCVWTTAAYERYLHARYPRNGSMSTCNYTPSKYATTLALGAGTLMFTIMGIVVVLG